MSAPTAKPTDLTSAHHPRNEWASEVHVYEPHTVGLPPIRQYLREVWRRREFALELARTKLRAQNFDTVIGHVWLVLNPILLALVYFVLIDIVRGGKRPPDFFAHLVADVFAYHFISGVIRDGNKSVVKGGKLILNSAFPRMLLPLSSVLLGIRRFLPTVIIYIPIHYISKLPVDWILLWVFPLFALMTMLAAGFGMLVAALQVYFRDLSSFLPYLLRLMLYSAPVLYFTSRVPERYKFVLDINPIAQLISSWDSVIHFGQAPSVHALVVGTAWSVGLLLVGSLFFMSREREFAVRL